MTMNITKYDLEGIPSLSCIESYVLATLYTKLDNAELLYYKSFLPFDEIYMEFFTRGVSYAWFSAVERIQDIARKHQIIALNFNENAGIEAIGQSGQYVCAGVTPEYLVRKYGEKAWRDDHYWLIARKQKQKNEPAYVYVNDHPLDEGVISENELRSAFSRKAILFSITGEITLQMQMEFVEQFTGTILNTVSNMVNFDLIPDGDLAKIRDFVGVLRVLRRRTALFLNRFVTVEFMQPYMRNTDKLYTTLEYMRLRGCFDRTKIIAMLTAAQEADTMLVKEVKNKLKEIKA